MELDEVVERAAKAARAKEKLKKFQAKNNALSKLVKSESTNQFDSGTTTPTSTLGTRSDDGEGISRPNSVVQPPISTVLSLEEGGRFEQQREVVRERIRTPLSPPPPPPPPMLRFNPRSSPSPSQSPSSSSIPLHISSPPPPPPASPSLLLSQQQTINLLVADKNSLMNRIRELTSVLTEKENEERELEVVGRQLGDTMREVQRLTGENQRLGEGDKRGREEVARIGREAELNRHTLISLQSQLSSKDTLLTETFNKLQELQSSTSLADLESKLRSKSERADSLELELSKSRAVYLKLRSEKEAVEKAEVEAKLQTEEIKKAYESLSIEKLKREEEVVLMKSKLVEITQLLESDRATLQNQASTLSTFQSDSSTSAEQLSVALRRISLLEETLAASEKKVEASNSRRDGLERENVVLLASLEELRGKVVALTNDQVVASDKNTLLQRILRERDVAIKAVHSELDELEKQLRLSREGSVELQARLTFLEDILASSKKEVAVVTEAKEVFQQESKNHLETITELQDSIKTITAARDEQISLVQTLEYTVSNLEEEVGSAGNLDEEVSRLKQQYSDMYAQHAEATKKLSELSTSTTELQQSFDNSKTELAKSQALLKEAQESHASLVDSSSNHTTSLLKELEESKLAANSHSTSFNSLQSEVDSHLKRISQQQTSLETLSTASNSHSERANTLADQLSKFQSDSLSTSNTLLLTESELATTKSALETSESNLSQLVTTLATSKSSLEDLQSQFSVSQTTLLSQETQVKGLESLLHSAKKEAETLAAELVELEKVSGKKVEELELKMVEISGSRDTLLEKITSLEQHLEITSDKQKQDEEGLNQKLFNSTRESEELKLSKASLESDLEKLRSNLSAVEQEQKSILAELDSSKSNSTILEQSLIATRQDLDYLTSIRDELTSTNESLTSSLEELRNSLTALNDSTSNHSELAASLAISLEQKELVAQTALATGEKLRLELESLRGEVQVAEEARKNAEEGLVSSQGSTESTTVQLGSVMDELEQTKREILLLEEGLKSIKDELENSKEEKEILLSTSSELRQSTESTNSQLETITSSRNQLEEQLSNLHRAMKEKDNTIAEAESGVAREIEAANQSVKENNVALNTANRRASMSEKELKAMIEAAGETYEEQVLLRSTISKLEEEVVKLKGGVEASSTEVANLSDELERNVSEVQELKGVVEGRKQEILESTTALEELREVFARAQEDLISKDVEIEEIRSKIERSTTPSIQVNGTTSDPSIYDRDYIDSLQQTHELDLSTARAQIRALEERIFTAEDTGYQMMKANGDLKAQVASMTDVVAKEREKVRRKEREVEALRAAEHDHFENGHSNSRSSISPPPRSSSARIVSPTRVISPPHNHSPSLPHSHSQESASSSHHYHTAPPLQALFSPSSPSLLPSTSPGIPPTSPYIRSSPRAYAHRRVASHLPAATESLISGQESSFPIPSPDQRLYVPTTSYDLPTPSSLPKDLPRSTRHARNASLSVLKTRMEDELGVDDLLQETLFSVGGDQNDVHRRMSRSAALGDDFVWCSSCDGDLIIV